LTFDPTDPEAIAGATDRLWHDAQLRDELRRAGHARARQFTWQRTAVQTLQVYRDAGAVVRGDSPPLEVGAGGIS
jgi:alpha-1,3-rhamnosyl/mannosyltransferase